MVAEDGGLEDIQTIGIVNSLKTGNVTVDMTMAMVIPIFIGFALNCASTLQKKLAGINWSVFFTNKSNYHERRIHHSTVKSAYTTTDLGGGDSQNELLIKAIQLYLDHKGILKLRNAEIELKQVGEEKKNQGYYYYGDEKDTSTLADTLSKYKVIKKPLKERWLDLGKHGKSKDMHDVRLMVNEYQEDLKGNESGSIQHKRVLTLLFRSEGEDSIDIFVETAYKWYLGQLRKLEDNSRYLYELKDFRSKGDEDDSDGGRKYKRYKLSDEKTFDSLFFKEKETILKIVGNFTSKTGKYAIKGYPNKLGILLHGPPGTGKTSLIKALAQRTGRSIVNVPLARITTNAELAAIFFDQKYYVEGERVPVTLNFKDIIFVIEDVDAVGKVVRRRDGKTTTEATYTESVNMPITKSLWRMMLESTNEDCRELVKLLIEKSKRLKEAAKEPSNLSSTAKQITSIPGLSLIGEEVESETASSIVKDSIRTAQKQMDRLDTLNEFIGRYAKSLMQMIESGSEVVEDFETELLGLSHNDGRVLGSFVSVPRPPTITHEVSFNKEYGDSEDNIVMESSGSDTCVSPVQIGPQLDSMADIGFGQTKKDSKKSVWGIDSTISSWKAKKDELNLSGLLNVLDGIVDTPGRLLIMTTNHPELLDPALIRPGRIDKKLLLSYMGHEDLVRMMEHYFQLDLNSEQVERLRKAVNEPPTLKLTPALVEQMVCEHEEIDEMIGALERKKELQKRTSIRSNQIVYNS